MQRPGVTRAWCCSPNPDPDPNPDPNLTLTRYYERAVAKPVLSYARLLVLVQRFSADCD